MPLRQTLVLTCNTSVVLCSEDVHDLRGEDVTLVYCYMLCSHDSPLSHVIARFVQVSRDLARRSRHFPLNMAARC